MELKEYFDLFKTGALDLRTLLGELRRMQHSMSESTRAEVVEILSMVAENDAQRELLMLYQTTQWRDTKLRIIKGLVNHPSNRTIEFLIHLARNESDLPLCEEAIWALGYSKHPIAAKFLVRSFENSSALTKPFFIGAIGQQSDRILAKEFLAELPIAIKENNALMAKNLILTLAELKVLEALPLIEALLNVNTNRALLLSAIVAFAKISRDARPLHSMETKFRQDLFEHELLRSAQTQIVFRSQWTLEDYLNKAFGAAQCHPMLPFELNTFPAVDVEAGLQMFAEKPEHRDRLCQVLSKVHFPETASWYESLFDFDKLEAAELGAVLTSLQSHYGDEFEKPLLKIRGAVEKSKDDDIFEMWLRVVALCLPSAERIFQKLHSDVLENWSTARKIFFINTCVTFALTYLSEPKKYKPIFKFIESLLPTSDKKVQGRAIRALGQLGHTSPASLKFARDSISDAQLAPSIVSYLENCPSKQAAELLVELAVGKTHSNLQHGLLRALSSQTELPEKNVGLETFFRDSLAVQNDPESKRLALVCLTKSPLQSLQKPIIDLLNDNEQIRIQAVIAVKALKQESTAELLIPLLAPTQSESVIGRTLDTLTALPGLRAKSIVVDFLEKNLDNFSVCEKIIRCLEPPPTANPGLAQRLEKIAEKAGTHPYQDGLLQLRDRFAQGGSRYSYTPQLNEKDVAQLDALLSQKIVAYKNIDEQAKAALRAAELPFTQTQMFEGRIDKSMSVVLYCKALDIILDKHYGQQFLIPRLESHLHQFQNVLHTIGLNTDSPNNMFLLKALGLERDFQPEQLPILKMSLLAKDFLSGRILNAHWKIIDGLRAWSAIILMFSREIHPSSGKKLAPIIPIKNTSDLDIASFCRRLLILQDARNPVAHRQTLLHFSDIQKVREEVMSLFSTLSKILL